jgi:UDP-3-O-[3-hydroxymyristoyl] glucosamine N-acyltransferase
VTKDVAPGTFMLGAPAVPHTKFKRIHAATQHLPELTDKLHELQRKLEEMRARQA